MKTNGFKQITIVLICSIGLYFSGLNLLEMSGVQSLLDGLNVMIFFTCLFPFAFVTLALFSKILKFIFKFSFQVN